MFLQVHACTQPKCQGCSQAPCYVLSFVHLHQHGGSAARTQPEQRLVLNPELDDVELGAVGGDPDPSFNSPL